MGSKLLMLICDQVTLVWLITGKIVFFLKPFLNLVKISLMNKWTPSSDEGQFVIKGEKETCYS